MAKQETKPFEYFDSPDGEDLFPKVKCLMKPAFLAAFGCGTVDVMLYTHAKGYLQTLGRYVHFAWPIIGGTTAFVLAHNVAGSLRGKDDEINWFIGGATAGAIFGIWRKNFMSGFNVAIAGGLVAAGKKCAVRNGYTIFPEIKPEYGGLRTVNHDFTLMHHRPGNWMTGKE